MKRIVVLGAAESGAGAAVLAKKKGFDVFVSDMSQIKDKYKKYWKTTTLNGKKADTPRRRSSTPMRSSRARAYPRSTDGSQADGAGHAHHQ
jgi:UDP-N-acetylmuramoylalanine-D-glutamate ligase